MLEILPVRFMFPVLMLLVGALGTTAQEQVANGDQPTKVIEVSAKKYELTPNEIHVHGIKLSLHAKGSKDKRSPGLLFSDPSQNGKVDKDKDQILEFVAHEAGTYEFECTKFCGLGHRRMKGKLVVDE